MRARSPQAQDCSLWQPSFGWRTSAISRLHNSFVIMRDEWQAFMGRRMNEDLHLWQELASAKTPQISRLCTRLPRAPCRTQTRLEFPSFTD
jgi:hypothetical protein